MNEAWRDAVTAAIAGCARVSPDAACSHVRAALAAGGVATHAGDIALAYAVSRADPTALRRFADLLAAEVDAAAGAVGGDAAFADELAQHMRVRMLVGEDGASPRITGYRGIGPLRAWVGIAARRSALNARRDANHHRATSDDDVLVDIVDREPDPELRHLKALYRGELGAALGAALAGLGDRARAVLRLRFVEGLELSQIGQLYRVHASTASRWITDALDQVARTTREHLVTRLAITSETAASVARMVHSQLDLSIARLLR